MFVSYKFWLYDTINFVIRTNLLISALQILNGTIKFENKSIAWCNIWILPLICPLDDKYNERIHLPTGKCIEKWNSWNNGFLIIIFSVRLYIMFYVGTYMLLMELFIPIYSHSLMNFFITLFFENFNMSNLIKTYSQILILLWHVSLYVLPWKY